MSNTQKLRRLNSKQINLWNTIITFNNGKSSQEIAKIINDDPGNIQRRLDKFKIIGTIYKKGSKYYVKKGQIKLLFPLIPNEYRINQNNYKIELLTSNLLLSFNEKVTESFDQLKKELINKMQNELSKETRPSRLNYSKISFEWLEDEHEEEEFLAQEVIEEGEEKIIIDPSKFRLYRENIPRIEEKDEEEEIFHVFVEKENN